MQLSGQSVLITGASGGLGQALQAAFAKAGARLWLADQNLDNLNGEASFAYNALDSMAMQAIATGFIETYGAPDIIIHNAGWTRAENLESLNSQNIEDEARINLTAIMLLNDLFLKALRKANKPAALVFISSVNAHLHFGNPAYAAAKAGIEAYMRGVAVEYGRYGIRANAICPGSIRTPAWDHRIARDASIPEKLRRLYPLGRIVEPLEVANAALFLASPLASGITGVSLAVDAGLIAGNRPFIDDILG